MSSLKEIKFNNHTFWELKPDFIHIGYKKVRPIENYEKPENFPNCCDFHKGLYQTAKEYFDLLPNCCTEHKEMFAKWNIDKMQYIELPEKIVNQISFTEHHITERINTNDWFNDITEYFEYNFESFGQPAIGLHIYIDNLIHWLKNTKNDNITQYKRNELINYINSLSNSNENISEPTDFNLLISIYQKWLKLFPFELSYFTIIKEHFVNQLPFLKGEIKNNRYTGLAKAKLHTRQSLIRTLFIFLLVNFNIDLVAARLLTKFGN